MSQVLHKSTMRDGYHEYKTLDLKTSNNFPEVKCNPAIRIGKSNQISIHISHKIDNWYFTNALKFYEFSTIQRWLVLQRFS